jgi:hypothetical protein
MPTVRLVEIPKPETNRDILERTPGTVEDLGPFILGAGDINLICGRCDKILADGLETGTQVRDIVFRCQDCGAYSETRI